MSDEDQKRELSGRCTYCRGGKPGWVTTTGTYSEDFKLFENKASNVLFIGRSVDGLDRIFEGEDYRVESTHQEVAPSEILGRPPPIAVETNPEKRSQESPKFKHDELHDVVGKNPAGRAQQHAPDLAPPDERNDLDGIRSFGDAIRGISGARTGGDVARIFEHPFDHSIRASHILDRNLEEWVARQGSFSSVLAATLVSNQLSIYRGAMHWSKGLLDPLRLGEGAADGGWGYVQDVLRLFSFAPTAKAASVIGAKHSTLPAVIGASIGKKAGRTGKLASRRTPPAIRRDVSGQHIYNSFFDKRLPEILIGPKISDARQFRFAMKELKQLIKKDEAAWRPYFSRRQWKALKDAMGASEKGVTYHTPKGFTWHHNVDHGVLQLVDRVEHNVFHFGGRFTTGGRGK